MKRTLILPFVAAISFFPGAAYSATVLSHTFDSTTQGWGTDDHDVTQAGGVLVVKDNGGAGATRAFTNFTSTNIGIGEVLTVQAEVFFTTTAAPLQSRTLNVGISNGPGTVSYVNRISAGSQDYEQGHYLDASMDASANNLILDAASIGATPSASTIRTNTSDAAYSHTIVFSLARTAANTIALTTRAEQGDGIFREFTATDTAATQFTFSRLDFGTFGNSNYDFNLDDVTVSLDTIPEPSSLALLGLGLGALALRKRR